MKKFLAILLVAVLFLTGCNRAVTAVPAGPTAVPSTAVPTATPTDIPTPTETPTDAPTPTATPFVLPALNVWAAANGFGHVGDNEYHDSVTSEGTTIRVRSEYYEKLGGNRIAFWVQDREYETEDYYPTRDAGVRMPGNTPKAEREQALDVWVENISQLLTPAIAEAIADKADGLTIADGWNFIQSDGYDVNYVVQDMGSGDIAFIVQASPNPLSDSTGNHEQNLYDEALAESVEAAASKDCLAVVPADLDFGEEFDSWLNQYLDNLSKELLGEEHPPMGSEIFLLPPSDRPDCVVMFNTDPASGDAFLIYETKNGFVKAPFAIPSGP